MTPGKLAEMLRADGPMQVAYEDLVVYDLYTYGDAHQVQRIFNYENGLFAWKVLREIFDKVLIKDPVWHFFYEGDTSILRCSEIYQEQVREILNHYNVGYRYTGTWRDSQHMTAKYQRVFTYLFHGFSVLAMVYEDNDFFLVTDRVIHCFCNHQWYRALHRREIVGEVLWEAQLLAEHATKRAAYCARGLGQWEGRQQLLNEQEAAKKAEKEKEKDAKVPG